MKFGKRLQFQIEETLPEWRDKFLSYKPLKKRLKQLSSPECFTVVGFCATSSPHEENSLSVVDAALQELRKGSATLGQSLNVLETESTCEASSLSPTTEFSVEANNEAMGQSDSLTKRHDRGKSGICDEAMGQSDSLTKRHDRGKSGICEEEDFIHLINEELEKFNNFFLEKEEEYVIYLQELKEKIDRVKEKSKQNGTYTSENEFNEEMIKIRKDIVTIHGEMVLLENYSALNFTGLLKILKKYDKRTGALLRLPFIQSVLQQPFFTTELLSKLVRECEANLKSVFPSIPLDDVGAGNSDHAANSVNGANAQETLLLQGDSVESIYRSTRAALRTIKDLQRGSSTYNPLSFPPFVPGKVEEGLGIVVDDKPIINSSHFVENHAEL